MESYYIFPENMSRLCGNYYQYRRMAMKNNKNDIIKFFVWMRNGIAFCTTWLLIIWIAYCHISNQQQISVSMLTKLLFFVIGGVLIFNILFTKVFIKNQLKIWLSAKTLYLSAFSRVEILQITTILLPLNEPWYVRNPRFAKIWYSTSVLIN